MGFREKMKQWAEEAENTAVYKGHVVQKGTYTFSPGGAAKRVQKPISGATAEFESGAANQKATVSRVAVGAIIAGPAGAIVGGLFKKDRTKCYVTVTFEDGDVAVVEGPTKDESKMRAFARSVSVIGRK